MTPYLSVVLAASNADYEGDFLGRLQKMIDNTVGLFNKYRISSEVIIVEWNPPKDKPRLKGILKWPESIIPIHIITVPEEFHNRVHNPAKWTFFEYAAKNVGIRRAKGKFILATNADILLSEEMVRRISYHQFRDHGEFCRADRYDLDASGKVYQVNRFNGTFLPEQPKEERISHPHYNAGGDFMLMAKSDWEKIKGYKEGTGYDNTLDGRLIAAATHSRLHQWILPEPIYHQFHTRNIRNRPEGYYDPRGWDDNNPVVEMNEDDSWGLNGVDLETTTIRLHRKLLVAIKSCNFDLDKQCHYAIRGTWLRKLPEGIDYKFFVGEGTSELKSDEVRLNCDDAYESLPFKTKEIFQWALWQGYDHVFICDTDSFPNIEALLAIDYQNYDYCGYFSPRYGIGVKYERSDSMMLRWLKPFYNFVSTHACFLSAKAMELIIPNEPYFWADDAWIGQILGPEIEKGNIKAASMELPVDHMKKHRICPLTWILGMDRQRELKLL